MARWTPLQLGMSLGILIAWDRWAGADSADLAAAKRDVLAASLEIVSGNSDAAVGEWPVNSGRPRHLRELRRLTEQLASHDSSDPLTDWLLCQQYQAWLQDPVISATPPTCHAMRSTSTWTVVIGQGYVRTNIIDAAAVRIVRPAPRRLRVAVDAWESELLDVLAIHRAANSHVAAARSGPAFEPASWP